MERIQLFFEQGKTFEPSNIKPLNGIVGLYFIYLDKIEVQYPFKTSRLIYIGMSEKKTNSIGSRLLGHFTGQSKNMGIQNYKKVENLFFTCINIDMLKTLWTKRIEDLESYFILDFVENVGVYPICNNKTGFEVLKVPDAVDFDIDWKFFN